MCCGVCDVPGLMTRAVTTGGVVTGAASGARTSTAVRAVLGPLVRDSARHAGVAAHASEHFGWITLLNG